MALPVTITNAIGAIASPCHFGPILASNGAFYVFAFKSSANTLVAAFKASDPTSSFSEVGTAYTIADSTPHSMWVYPAGTTIHVAVTTNGGTISHNSFATATDTWGTPTSLEDAGPTPITKGASIALRSDGDRLIAYTGNEDAVMGTPYDRADYRRWEGVSWSGSAIDITGNTGAEVNYENQIIVMSSNDRGHIFFKDDTNSDLKLSTVLSNNNFGQTGSTTPGPSTQDADVHTDDRPIGCGVWASSKVWLPYEDASGKTSIASFSDADNPTATISADVGDNAVKANSNGVALHALATDGTDIHLVYIGSANDHLYHAVSTAGGAFAADVDEKTLTSCTMLSANIYDRSGAKLAFVWWDGSALVYDEISLVAAPAATSLLFPPLRASMMSMLMR